VGIERYDEPGRRHPRPHTQIEGVPADHPPQEQIHSLAAAARGGAGKEIADARTFRHSAVRRAHVERQRTRGKTVERAFDILRRRVVAFEKEILD